MPTLTIICSYAHFNTVVFSREVQSTFGEQGLKRRDVPIGALMSNHSAEWQGYAAYSE
jgi:hypothetical protein